MEASPSLVGQFVDFLLHLDAHLSLLLSQYGNWVYAILFLIVFCETGLVVCPFLPGDSLLFVAGALAAPLATGDTAGLQIEILIPVLLAAAWLGNNTNYWIGRRVGPNVFRWEQSRWFNRAAFDKAHAFYEKHGGKTLLIARFLPLVRTFAPFVAGVARMTYSRFVMMDLLGGACWVISLTVAGYLFGNIPVIRNNLTAMILGIIALSLLPLLIVWVQSRRK